MEICFDDNTVNICTVLYANASVLSANGKSITDTGVVWWKSILQPAAVADFYILITHLQNIFLKTLLIFFRFIDDLQVYKKSLKNIHN